MSTPFPTAPTDPTAADRPSPFVGRVYGEPRFHTDGDVAGVAFAADGTLFSVDEAGVLRHWSADGHLLRRMYLSDLETLWCFAPGAARLASGNDDLLFWDTATGTLAHRLPQPAWVTALAFSADGRILASGHDDGKVRFWDAAAHKFLGEIAAHPRAVSAIAFAPAGDRLATAGEDRAVRVWDADTHAKLAELLSHTDRVPALAWKPDGSLLVSAGWDTAARVWDVANPDPVMLLNSHSDQVVGAAFAPDGAFLATVDSDDEIRLWSDAAAGTVGHVLRGHADEVRCLAFSPDGTRLASAGADRVVHVWDTRTGALVAGPNPTGRHDVAVFPGTDGKLKVASTGGPLFRVWDAETGAEEAPTGDGPAHAVAASDDGHWLAVGGTDYVTRLYDRINGGEPRRLEATKPPIGSLSFAPGGHLVAQASPADGLVWLWNPAAGDPMLILIEAADGCTLEGVAVLPDGRIAVGGIDYLSTGERTGAVCVWDVGAKKKQHVFDIGVYAIAADPSGRYLAGAGIDDAVYVWDLATGEEVFALDGHTGRVNAVAFSPDGSYLVSAGDDQTVRVWDVLSGRLLVAREFDASVQAIAFSPDGRSLFTGNGNTTCYRLDVKKLLDE